MIGLTIRNSAHSPFLCNLLLLTFCLLQKIGDNEATLASSDPYVSFAQEHPDFQASTTGAEAGAASQPPSQDVFVPFPRTSGVRISPSGLMVTFGLHQPLVEIVQAASPVHLGSTRTPRSFHDYLQLTEGKEHLFCMAADSSLVRQQARLSQTVDQIVGGPLSQLKRSLSAEAICGGGGGGGVGEAVQDTYSTSLVTFGSPKNANRRRYYSGKTSTESGKVSCLCFLCGEFHCCNGLGLQVCPLFFFRHPLPQQKRQ